MTTNQTLNDIKLGDVISYQYPDSDHLWGLRVMSEPSEVEGFKDHITGTGKQWMIGIHHSLIPSGYELVKKISKSRMEDFFQSDIRVGRFIHLPTALLDYEDPSDDFAEFFEYNVQPFLISSTGDFGNVKRLEEEYESLEETACFYQRRPEQYLIEIKYPTPVCMKKGDSVKTSTWLHGCKYVRWVLTDCIETALAYAEFLLAEKQVEAFCRLDAMTSTPDLNQSGAH